jgi:predicted nuclease with TOPRIM domain
MSEALQLEQAEAAAKLAAGELDALRAEQAKIEETFEGRSLRDVDEMARLKKRQIELAPLIFDATIKSRKAAIEAMGARREISQEATQEAIRLVGERERPLQDEIDATEQRLAGLKFELSTIHSNRDQAQRDVAEWTKRIAEAEDLLRDFIRRWTPDAPPEPKAVTAAAVPLGGNLTHVGPV